MATIHIRYSFPCNILFCILSINRNMQSCTQRRISRPILGIKPFVRCTQRYSQVMNFLDSIYKVLTFTQCEIRFQKKLKRHLYLRPFESHEVYDLGQSMFSLDQFHQYICILLDEVHVFYELKKAQYQ